MASGCGASATIGPAPNTGPTVAELPSAAVHNDADVTFATAVVVLHRRAVAAAAPAAQGATEPRVKALAAEVLAVDQPEIDSLTSYLQAWDAPVPAEQPGVAPDRSFLDTVLTSTPDVVAAARREQQTGRYEPARELAGLILTEQTARVDRARSLRG
ncbi:MAG: hypothetical protein QOJ32_1014 [Frankiaceae bacterium]|nr:hypothetical protein [Frankiaceae bacterium]